MKRHLILLCALPAIAIFIYGDNVQAQHRRHGGSSLMQRISRHNPLQKSRHIHVVPSSRRNRSNYYYSGNTFYYHSGCSSDRSQRVAFGSFSHTGDLADRLETLASCFCREIKNNYSRNRHFSSVYREAYEVWEIAKYIHREEHHGHHDEIAKEVCGLDELFHHLHEEVAHWRLDHNHHHHGDDPEMHELLEQMDSVIRHLKNDAGVR